MLGQSIVWCHVKETKILNARIAYVLIKFTPAPYYVRMAQNIEYFILINFDYQLTQGDFFIFVPRLKLKQIFYCCTRSGVIFL